MTLAASPTIPAFDAESHTYSLGGRALPSVTQIIGAVFPGWQASEWHMQRGTALHHGCRLLDEGQLDWSSVAPEIEPRIRAWETFSHYHRATPLLIERAMMHPLYQFAGTPDRVFGCVDLGVAVIDIKSSLSPQVRVQLGAYSLLWTADGHRPANRAGAVELRDDGTYSCLWMDQVELRRAEQTFLACLTVYNFAKKHNLKLQGDSRDANA